MVEGPHELRRQLRRQSDELAELKSSGLEPAPKE
jgi:hypothetical protein